MGKVLIVVAGCVAGGKTTFSQRLSAELGIPVFNKDLIKITMGNHIEVKNREDSKTLSRATFDIMAHVAECLMKTGQTLVLESNFIRAEGEVLRELAERYAYRLLTFVFTGDLRVLHKRFVERDNSPERAAVNRIFGLLDDFETFKNAVGALSEFDVGDTVVKIDTTHFDTVDFEALIRQAHAFTVN